MNKYQKMLAEGKNLSDIRKIRRKIAVILKDEGQLPIPYDNEIKIEKVKQHLSIGVLEARSKMVWDFIFNRSITLAIVVLFLVGCKQKEKCPAYTYETNTTKTHSRL